MTVIQSSVPKMQSHTQVYTRVPTHTHSHCSNTTTQKIYTYRLNKINQYFKLKEKKCYVYSALSNEKTPQKEKRGRHRKTSDNSVSVTHLASISFLSQTLVNH